MISVIHEVKKLALQDAVRACIDNLDVYYQAHQLYGQVHNIINAQIFINIENQVYDQCQI